MTIHPHAPLEPPSDLHSEYALLGALMSRPDTLDEIEALIEERHFYEPFHGRIFVAIKALIEQGIAPSVQNVKKYLADDPSIEFAGPEYFQNLADSSVLAFDIQLHAEGVREMASRRLLIEVGSDMVATAAKLDALTPASTIAEAMQERLSDAIVGGNAAAGFVSIGEAAQRAASASETAYQSKVPLGLSTGFRSLDALMGRLKPGDLIFIGGATSSGKTAIALDIAEGAARQIVADGTGGCVGIFSMEMSKEELATRSMSKVAEISGSAIEDGTLSEAQMMAVFAAADALAGLPILIDDKRALSLAMIRARGRRLVRKKNCKLIIIDHLGFIRPSNPRMTEIERTKEATSGLKALAGELHVPILVLSHLNRENFKRANPRPILSDLYGSSGIEQDSDVVLFIFREEYYLERNHPGASASEQDVQTWEDAMRAARGKAEAILGKGRRRGVGTTQLLFDAHVTRFRDPPIEQTERML